MKEKAKMKKGSNFRTTTPCCALEKCIRCRCDPGTSVKSMSSTNRACRPMPKCIEQNVFRVPSWTLHSNKFTVCFHKGIHKHIDKNNLVFVQFKGEEKICFVFLGKLTSYLQYSRMPLMWGILLDIRKEFQWLNCPSSTVFYNREMWLLLLWNKITFQFTKRLDRW